MILRGGDFEARSGECGGGLGGVGRVCRDRGGVRSISGCGGCGWCSCERLCCEEFEVGRCGGG